MESGIVGGGYYFQQGKLGIRVGPVATVWDGEIAGLERGIKAAGNRDWDILLLTDSKAAIQATKNAGIRGKARTRALAALGNEINKRQALYGRGNVKIGWVKSHIGIAGNEEADAMAKMGAEKESGGEITEGGIRQRQKEIRKRTRESPEFLCIAKWDRKSATTYTHLRCNKGNLQSWRFKIGKAETDLCRWCAMEEETGEHVVFKCPHWKANRVKRQVADTYRTWETWEDRGLRKVWTDKGSEGEKDIDHVYEFFSKCDLT